MAAVAERMVILGHLGAPWGIKGWIRVQPFASDPQALFSSRTHCACTAYSNPCEK